MSTLDSARSSRAPQAWRLVAEREITTRVRQKSFIISVLVTVLLVAGVVVAASLFGGRTDHQSVGVVGPQARSIMDSAAESPLITGGDIEIKVKEFANADQAESAVRTESIDAALVPDGDGFRLIGLSDIDSTTETAITATVSQVVTQANADAQGVDLEALSAGSTVSTQLLDAAPENSSAKQGVAALMVVVFLMAAMVFGLGIAQSVTEEKESRIVEILAAAVPIRSLLWGKVAGNTVLAIGQVLAVVVAGVVAAAAMGEGAFLGDIGPAIGWFLVLFILGFVAMATLWAVGGSLASRVQDVNSTTLPIQAILFVPYMVAVTGSDAMREVLSMVPIAATMVMPQRLVTEDVPLWQLGVAIGGTIIVAVLFVKLGVRIYERSLLRTGNKIGFRQALRLSED